MRLNCVKCDRGEPPDRPGEYTTPVGPPERVERGRFRASRDVPVAAAARMSRFMIAVYSNRLGCVGSLLVSLVGTLVLGGVVYLLSR